MALEIKVLDYGDIELESSFLVLGRNCGRVARVHTYGFLILGGQYPILVDTGFRDNAIMESLGMRGLAFHDNLVESQLARHGLRPGDIRFICHTHLHIDHAGQDDKFPMNTTVVLNRREMECSVSGLMHPQYPKPDIMHLVERLHTPGALRFEDLELSGPIELIPGVVLEAANAHTDGSMNVHVETAEGRATICGDVIYDIQNQVVDPFHQTQANEPQIVGNRVGATRGEKAAIKKLLNGSKFLLPVHDKPAKVEGGQIAGRLDMEVPGPVSQTVQRRNWFPV